MLVKNQRFSNSNDSVTSLTVINGVYKNQLITGALPAAGRALSKSYFVPVL
jgi:hypothetical protein